MLGPRQSEDASKLTQKFRCHLQGFSNQFNPYATRCPLRTLYIILKMEGWAAHHTSCVHKAQSKDRVPLNGKHVAGKSCHHAEVRAYQALTHVASNNVHRKKKPLIL